MHFFSLIFEISEPIVSEERQITFQWPYHNWVFYGNMKWFWSLNLQEIKLRKYWIACTFFKTLKREVYWGHSQKTITKTLCQKQLTTQLINFFRRTILSKMLDSVLNALLVRQYFNVISHLHDSCNKAK